MFKFDMKTTGAGLIFGICLIAYTLQTELAQYVQQEQKYRKPYFLLYMTHSGYLLILPLHLTALRLLGIPIPDSFRTLRLILRRQFGRVYEDHPNARPGLGRSGSSMHGGDGGRPKMPRSPSLRRLVGKEEREKARTEWKRRFGFTVLCLTCLIAAPALLWYSAVPMTSMTNLTSLYNTFAFWAYLFAIKFLGEPASRWKLGSVVLAVVGVFVISYGDAAPATNGRNPLLGNLLALAGSIAYAWYEVWYKRHIALPETEGGDEDGPSAEDEADALLAADDVEATGASVSTSSPSSAEHHPKPLLISTPVSLPTSVTNPSPAMFLLHANFITAMIGFCTFFVLWLPVPFLHWFGWEEFELPPRESWWPIVGIIVSGVGFNAGFMLLLSLWGPIVASVGNLLTLILVGVTDAFISGTSLTLYSIVGSGMVAAAFAFLVVGAKAEEGDGHAVGGH